MNVVRTRIVDGAKALGIDVDETTGADTAFARRQLRLGKSHCADALAASWDGQDGIPLVGCVHPIHVKAASRGRRQAIRPDSYGFPETNKVGERIRPRRGPRPHGIGCGDRVVPATPGGRRGVVVNARGDARTTVQMRTGERKTVQAKHLKVVERRGGHRAHVQRHADDGLRSAPLNAPG